DGLRTTGDTDLHGFSVGFDRNLFRWELMGLLEKSNTPQDYELGAATSSFATSKLDRKIFGVRAKANLKDAFLKGEYYMQEGTIRPSATGASDIKLGGGGYVFGLGGKANNKILGRFGAILE